jgi:voltage-gated potassium channel Kch
MLGDDGRMMSHWIAGGAGVALLLGVALDAFEAVVLPRRVTRRFRLTRLYYRATWKFASRLVRVLRSKKRRDALLSFYGPLSLLLLMGVWAAGMIVGFALLHYGAGSALHVSGMRTGFATDLYLSGSTFFTLGLGDVVPRSVQGRVLTVAEAGVGFGFLALLIGYMPVIYQSFSRREVGISLLDARAGSPPSAGELLRRHGGPYGLDKLQSLLAGWERWAAELLESHLSYPVVAYYRSQHDNQSWLMALTTILDTCALLIMGQDGACKRQAELTFAMARHAVVDLSQVFHSPPRTPPQERLTREQLHDLRDVLAQHGLRLNEDAPAAQRLAELRAMYEPYVHALAGYFDIELPTWVPKARRRDNWQTSAWGRASRHLRDTELAHDDHA